MSLSVSSAVDAVGTGTQDEPVEFRQHSEMLQKVYSDLSAGSDEKTKEDIKEKLKPQSPKIDKPTMNLSAAEISLMLEEEGSKTGEDQMEASIDLLDSNLDIEENDLKYEISEYQKEVDKIKKEKKKEKKDKFWSWMATSVIDLVAIASVVADIFTLGALTPLTAMLVASAVISTTTSALETTGTLSKWEGELENDLKKSPIREVREHAKAWAEAIIIIAIVVASIAAVAGSGVGTLALANVAADAAVNLSEQGIEMTTYSSNVVEQSSSSSTSATTVAARGATVGGVVGSSNSSEESADVGSDSDIEMDELDERGNVVEEDDGAEVVESAEDAESLEEQSQATEAKYFSRVAILRRAIAIMTSFYGASEITSAGYGISASITAAEADRYGGDVERAKAAFNFEKGMVDFFETQVSTAVSHLEDLQKFAYETISDQATAQEEIATQSSSAA
jgi:hypothetical protein